MELDSLYTVAVEEDHRGGTVSQESDVTDAALGRKRNGDAPLGYSGRTALRREQCDMSTLCWITQQSVAR
jgi:hypothetical protein